MEYHKIEMKGELILEMSALPSWTAADEGRIIYNTTDKKTYIGNDTEWVDCTYTNNFGIEWTIGTTTLDNDWKGLAYGNGLFVSVGVTSTSQGVMTSPDGINWTIRTTPSGLIRWRGITYGNGLFVAISYDTGDDVMTSPDGITWTSRSSSSSGNWRGITYGNGLFVATADGGAGDKVMTSPDGINWTGRTSADNKFCTGVTYGNGLFVAVSSNGTGNRVMTSTDGKNWTSRNSAADSNWTDITYGNGLFVAVAYTGAVNQVMTSPDGTNWTGHVSSTDNAWESVTYGNGLFVAVAYTGAVNRVMTSPDGTNWTGRTSGDDANGWVAVTYGNGMFVATANSGSGNRVMTSGTTTENVVPETLLNLPDTPIVYDDGKVLTSTVSGSEWVTPITTLLSLSDTPSAYDNGKVLTSTAGGSEWVAPTLSDKIFEGDTSVECIDAGSGAIVFTTDNNERMNLDANGALILLSLGTTKTSGALYTGSSDPDGSVRLNYDGDFYATSVYNAVFSDVADFQALADNLIYGKCYYDTIEGAKICNKNCQLSVIGIASDTYGFGVGVKSGNNVPIAVAGWVLAYVDKEYECGTPLTNNENGDLTEISLEIKRDYPERIVAIYKKKEEESCWGLKDRIIVVDGRHWVKVK